MTNSTITFETYSDMFTDYDEYIENENYDDEERVFTVPKDWAIIWIRENCEMSLEEFLDEYTSDDTNDMYCAAILDDVLIEEHIEAR